MTERYQEISTAKDLLDFLSSLPANLLERLPVEAMDGDGTTLFYCGTVEAIEILEDGAVIRSLRLIGNE